jgi:hypothetical protein
VLALKKKEEEERQHAVSPVASRSSGNLLVKINDKASQTPTLERLGLETDDELRPCVHCKRDADRTFYHFLQVNPPPKEEEEFVKSSYLLLLLFDDDLTHHWRAFNCKVLPSCWAVCWLSPI